MSFNPQHHGFQKIDFTPAPGISFFELMSDKIALLEADFLRLNVYLSQDGDFINIWFGLLDTIAAEGQLGFQDDQRINFDQIYSEPLFRGYIEDSETAVTILNALRVGKKFTPQALRLDDQGRLECYRLMEV